MVRCAPTQVLRVEKSGFELGRLKPYKTCVPPEATSYINASTSLCGIFGHPIAHSASPAMQNAGLRALGLNTRYVAFDVHPEQLQAALTGARVMGFIGLNLTVPHKLLAVPMMDELDETARTWGAVNTVCFQGEDEDGVWRPLLQLHRPGPARVRARGFNTDAYGLLTSLKEDLHAYIESARVMVLGAGGAGRVAALLLASEGVGDLFLVNRTRDKAEALAAEIRERFPNVRVMTGYPHREVDLIINATSLGLKLDDPLPLDENRFALGDARAVYDMVYRPAQTALLARAAECGCRTMNGLGMLLHQGVRALEIWTGRPAPVDVMRQALKQEIYGD